MANRKYVLTEDGRKSCTKCGELKFFTDFSPRKKKDGSYYPGGCSRCKQCQNALCDKWALENKTYNVKRGKTYRLEKRKIVIAHYGGKCDCCNESRYEFLAIDHINGNGTKHRKELGFKGQGHNFINWLINQGLPSGYRVLCHNCNFAMGVYGQCPHQADYDFGLYLERVCEEKSNIT